MKTKIALWGYGYYGHDIEAAVRDSWSEDYEITAVFDRNYQKMNSGKLMSRQEKD